MSDNLISEAVILRAGRDVAKRGLPQFMRHWGKPNRTWLGSWQQAWS
jgi:hypothetical protein